MGGEVDGGCRRREAGVYGGEKHGMAAATATTVDTDTRLVYILTVVPHIVKKFEGACRLIDMCTGSAVGGIAHLCLALAVAVEVKVYADGAHARQRSEPFLLVGATAGDPMAVRTDNERVLALGGGGIDSAEDVLSGGEFQADVLRGIAVVTEHFGENRLGIAHTGVEESVYAQPLAHLAAQRVAACLPLAAVLIEGAQVVEHLPALVSVAARIFVGLDLIQPVVLLPPVPVEVLADVGQRLLQRVGTEAPVGIRQLHTCGVYVILEAHAPLPLHVAQQVGNTSRVVPGIVVLGAGCADGHAHHQQ